TMSRLLRPALLLCAVVGASLIGGCTSYRTSEQPPDMDSTAVEYSGSGLGVVKSENVDSGFFVPDGRGRMLWNQGSPRQAPNPATAEAQELRLKVRELAAQLLETRTNEGLAGLVALPTSFVNLNNFAETTPFGRYISEAMFYEFNQRGVSVREYRLDGSIRMLEGSGEFALTRNLPSLATTQTWGAVLVGTYLREQNGLFVNARLVRPSDGMVLRTAQLVLGTNAMLSRMTAPPPRPPLSSGTLRIVPPSGPSEGRVVMPRSVPKRSYKRPSSRKAPVRAAPQSKVSPAQASPHPAQPSAQARPAQPGSLDSSTPNPGEIAPPSPFVPTEGTPMPGPAKNS
ncbi:MAG: FlgO family outer membrane protein, partial [Bilophila sp.]